MTKYKILDILRKRKGEYISGEYLRKEIGVSRTAIWKGIQSLKKKGYNIDGVNNKGYSLMEDDSISEYEIKKNILCEELGKKIYYFETIDSTNSYAKREIGKLNHGDIIIADEQSKGRGKLESSFYSPKESGIYMSIVLKENIFSDSLKLLSLGTVLAIMKSIEKVVGIKPETNWNEIFLKGKKVCGILTECNIEFETGKIEDVIIGIGLNANNSSFPNYVSEEVSSLKIILGEEVNRKEIICSILEEFENINCKQKYILNRKEMIEEYSKYLNIINKKVEIKYKDRIIVGIVEKINKNGGLVIIKETGRKEILYKGTIKKVDS
ncbi:MAG: biotin--[acetyl-CoA-carboxylase] ligase [Fusobacterium sp. JB021]|nr:biotin--[acetyl-CoA-carboxylase] ligase [Fusobacterium sp. JB021]MDP0507534.1 biotin--[acetyl-CoA-carboxylase] ligase [Fusobacterium sp. JB019]